MDGIFSVCTHNPFYGIAKIKKVRVVIFDFFNNLFQKKMELLGHTLDVVGKILVSYTAIAVHYRVRKEHKIDESVFKVMKKEQYLGLIGIILIIIGFILEIPAKM
jgi:hypothetical protein